MKTNEKKLTAEIPEVDCGAPVLDTSYLSRGRHRPVSLARLLITGLLIVAVSGIPLTALPQQKKEEPKMVLQCVAALTVIVVGGVVIYKLIKFCRAHFPPIEPERPGQTNQSPATFTASDTNFYAAIFLIADESSGDEIFVEWGDGSIAEVVTVTRDVFFESLTKMGLPNFIETPAIPGQSFFGLNGQAMETSPIQGHLSKGGFVVTFADSTNRIVLSRSTDLKKWTPFATNNVPNGFRLQMTMPKTEGNEFFRSE